MFSKSGLSISETALNEGFSELLPDLPLKGAMKKAESECFQPFLFSFTCYSTSFCLVGVIHAVKHLTSAQFSKSRVLVHSSRVEPVVFISSISKILISVTSTELFSLKRCKSLESPPLFYFNST